MKGGSARPLKNQSHSTLDSRRGAVNSQIGKGAVESQRIRNSDRAPAQDLQPFNSIETFNFAHGFAA